MTKLTDPAADLVKAHAEKWKDKPEKDLKEAENAAKQAEKDAIRAARLKEWKRPVQGDPDPDDSKKKLTKAKAKQLDDAGRAARRAAWEARR